MGRAWWLAGTSALAAVILLLIAWHLILMDGMQRRIARAAARGDDVATILGDQLGPLLGDRVGALLDHASASSLRGAVRVRPFANLVLVNVPVNEPGYRPAVEMGLSRARSVLAEELTRRFDVFSMIIPLRVELAAADLDESGTATQVVGWAVTLLLLIYCLWAGLRLWTGRASARRR